MNHSAPAKDLSAYRLEFQPVVSLADGTVHHYEALARFSDGSDPGETIRGAEDSRAIPAFDLSAARRTAAAISACARPVRVAANISGGSIAGPGFVRELLAAVSGVPAPRLLFEITETAEIHDLRSAAAAIQTLRQAGHLVCLDDLGAGWMGADYLRALPVDIVKIDGAFVAAGDRAGLTGLVALCRESPVRIVAEMVETAEAEALVRELGFDLAQGWRFGRPSPSLDPQVAA